ncbi:MAG: hypothetical protein D6828_02855, partial [Nitrospirae bacterium]
MDVPLFELALIFYFISALTGIIELFKSNKFISKLVFISAILGFILHSANIGVRYMEAKHLPVVNFHEAISFFAWSIVLLF